MLQAGGAVCSAVPPCLQFAQFSRDERIFVGLRPAGHAPPPLSLRQHTAPLELSHPIKTRLQALKDEMPPPCDFKGIGWLELFLYDLREQHVNL